MALYRHYKSGLYKTLGTVKHSETEEELVLYQTLYDNPTGRLWVRPQSMFHEEITIEDVRQPRFHELTIDIQEFTELRPALINSIVKLMSEIFGLNDEAEFHKSLAGFADIHVALALIEGQLAGFKMGRRQNHDTFYSWLGGVKKEWRGAGVAKALMGAQHEWCRKQGYQRVQTKTQNHFQQMLLLNIRSGFEIVGTELCPHRGLKIILEKDLAGECVLK